MRKSGGGLAPLILALLLGSPVAAIACTCTDPPTLEQEFENAYVVFSGRVLSMNPSPFGDYLEVWFQPIQRWKGPLHSTALVVTPSHEGICGFPFQVGGEYLLFCTLLPYGITYTPTPFTHLCTRTSPLADNPYLALLPPPLLPTPATRPSWGTLKLHHR